MKVRWTRLASSHLESAHEYIARDRANAVDDVVERILSVVERLQQHPQMGRKGRVSGTRELVIVGTPFVVAYRLRRDRVEVLAVLHAARRWPDRL